MTATPSEKKLRAILPAVESALLPEVIHPRHGARNDHACDFTIEELALADRSLGRSETLAESD